MKYLLLYQKLGSNGKNPCVILLFKSWILDSRAKFIIGCFGVIFLGLIWLGAQSSMIICFD